MILSIYRVTIFASINDYVRDWETGTIRPLHGWATETLGRLVPDCPKELEDLEFPWLENVPAAMPGNLKTTSARRVWMEEHLGSYLSYVALLLQTTQLLRTREIILGMITMFPLVSDGNFARRVLLVLPYKALREANVKRLDDTIEALERNNRAFSATGEDADTLPGFAEMYTNIIFAFSAMEKETVVNIDDVVVGQAMSIEEMSRMSKLDRYFLRARLWYKRTFDTPEKRMMGIMGVGMVVLMSLILFRRPAR